MITIFSGELMIFSHDHGDAMRETYLPTISELQAFVACTRTGSVTRAAEALNLTQSAVSRSLTTLENRLGVRLFHRVRKRLVLSDAGRVFRREAERLLAGLDQAAVTVMAFGGHDVLRLATLPTLGAKWLVPRLARFRAAHPGVTFDLSSRLDAIDFDNDPLDGAIQRTDLRPAGAEAMVLMEEVLIVVAAPTLLSGPAGDADLARLPLLQQSTRPTLWLDWFRDTGIDPRSILRGDRFEHFGMVATAAAGGLGLALVPEVLVADDLASGRLVRASERRVAGSAPYALLYPERSAASPIFRAFRDWLADEAGTGTLAQSRAAGEKGA